MARTMTVAILMVSMGGVVVFAESSESHKSKGWLGVRILHSRILTIKYFDEIPAHGEVDAVAHLDESVKSAGSLVAESTTNNRKAYSLTGSYEHIALLEMEPSGPAEQAGLAKGDAILALEGVSIESYDQFSALLDTYHEGDRVTVKYKRFKEGDNQEREVQVVLGKRPDGSSATNERPMSESDLKKERRQTAAIYSVVDQHVEYDGPYVIHINCFQGRARVDGGYSDRTYDFDCDGLEGVWEYVVRVEGLGPRQTASSEE